MAGHWAPNQDVVSNVLGLEEVGSSEEMLQCSPPTRTGVGRKEAGPECGGRGATRGQVG